MRHRTYLVSALKVVPIIKCTCTVFIHNLRNIQETRQYKHQLVGVVMTDMRSIKEIFQPATLGILNGIKNAISIAFSLDILTTKENVTSDECKTKNCLK